MVVAIVLCGTRRRACDGYAGVRLSGFDVFAEKRSMRSIQSPRTRDDTRVCQVLERPFFLPEACQMRVERALFSRAGSSTRINRERRVSTRFRSSSTGELPTDAARASNISDRRDGGAKDRGGKCCARFAQENGEMTGTRSARCRATCRRRSSPLPPS